MSTASRWRRNVALAICSVVALEQKAPALQSANRLERASSAIQALSGWFDENTGLYKNYGMVEFCQRYNGPGRLQQG
jgi:hypothetical protein